MTGNVSILARDRIALAGAEDVLPELELYGQYKAAADEALVRYELANDTRQAQLKRLDAAAKRHGIDPAHLRAIASADFRRNAALSGPVSVPDELPTPAPAGA